MRGEYHDTSSLESNFINTQSNSKLILEDYNSETNIEGP